MTEAPADVYDQEVLDARLEVAGCNALLSLAGSSEDPAIALFAGPGRVAPCFVIAPHRRPARLGFLNPMERGEAARTPLPLLDPEALDVARWTRDGAEGAELWTPVLQRALQLCEVAPGKLALTGSFSAGVVAQTCRALAEWGWSFEDGERIAARLRKRKSNAVLQEIRRSAAGVSGVMRSVAGSLAHTEIRPNGTLAFHGEPLTVSALKAQISLDLSARRLSQPERCIIAPAEEGGIPHSVGTDDRVLRAGESLVVDVFPRGRAFADCTRTFCVGEPSAALADAYALVREAVRVAERHARAGLLGFEVQRKVCDYFHNHGWPTPVHDPGTQRGYVHGLGHGVGFDLHELPSFREHAPGDEARLEAGDVITLEPGLYEPAPEDGSTGWGVRLEDTYLVTEDGLENLTPIPRDLNPRAWLPHVS